MTRSMISALALAGAMMFSGAAMAQTMVGSANVSAEDLPKVQAACDTLNAKEGGSLVSQTDSDPGVAKPGASSDASSGETDNGLDTAATTSIDLSLLTLDDCKKAGLIK